MTRIFLALLASTALGACDIRNDSALAEEPQARATPEEPAVQLPPGETVTGANGLDLILPAGLTSAMLGERDVEKLAVQVMLDRSNFSPGVIDGFGGGNTDNAIRAFRREAGLPDSDAIDAELLDALLEAHGGDIFRSYTITQADLRGSFEAVPESLVAQAELERLGHASPREMLAERFHMDEDLLAVLNPDADFGKVGTTIATVSHGSGRITGEIARIEVRKADNAVVALAEDGSLMASYPATIGSGEFPSPTGSMEVVTVAPDANYTFNAERQNWGPDEDLVIAAGPNNPVGGIWIDLSKAGYGIHGSPDPQLIGKNSSHGCVRLTNWDARELAEAVSAGVPVVFV